MNCPECNYNDFDLVNGEICCANPVCEDHGKPVIKTKFDVKTLKKQILEVVDNSPRDELDKAIENCLRSELCVGNP